MDHASEQRRVKVHELLAEGTSAKLQRFRTSDALDVLKRAYDLATKEPKLPRPIPQLAAYRYAQLRLRSNPQDEEELKKIDELFAYAARATSLNAFTGYRLSIASGECRRSMRSF
jgi:hypothetical protein